MDIRAWSTRNMPGTLIETIRRVQTNLAQRGIRRTMESLLFQAARRGVIGLEADIKRRGKP